MKHKRIIFSLITSAVIVAAVIVLVLRPQPMWSESELVTLRSLWIGSLPDLPHDPSNRYADDPQAATFGQKLFFDTRFSANGQVACATCHLPDRLFQDDLPLAQGIGTTTRRTMTLLGTAYSPWLFWDGRKDSQWAQALGPLENPVEHGGNRGQYVHIIADHYRTEYETIFGPLPDVSHLPVSAGPVDDPQVQANWEALSPEDQEIITQIYVNMGKAIAAYERYLIPGSSRFDTYVEAVLNDDAELAQTILTPDEIAGLRLFIGRANCLQCHNGPMFTDNHFHNTGIPAVADLPEDSGRLQGAAQVQMDEFNCLSLYSDAAPQDCAELRFMVAEGEELIRAFRPPSLRHVAERAPYMHAGQFETLEQVVRHYNRAPEGPAGHSELEPLRLDEVQLAQLVAFLQTLSGPLQLEAAWLTSPINEIAQ